MKHFIVRCLFFPLSLCLAFAGATLSKGQESQPDDGLKSQLEVHDVAPATSAPNAYRILFIGDSITRHGTNTDVKKRLGWDHVAGMAASSEDKDYAHLLAARIQKTMPNRKVEIYYSSQGKPKNAGKNPYKSGSAAALAFAIDGSEAFKPNLVVIQLGEHEEQAKGEAFLRESYEKLVTSFDGWQPCPRVLFAGVWCPGDAAKGRDPYRAGWIGTIERVQREVCTAHGIPFVSVRAFALDPSCRGSGTSPGVKWHPNDKGHEGYASALFAAFEGGK